MHTSDHRRSVWYRLHTSLKERDGERSFLEYIEDGSKNRPGGLKGRHIGQKVVRHYQNNSDPSRCFIRLFTLYRRHCPPNPKRNSFYLKPLKKTTGTIWYTREPLGHNSLNQAVASMCKAAEIPGFRTNHSLRATSATRLYAAGTDEQLIMEQTGHRCSFLQAYLSTPAASCFRYPKPDKGPNFSNPSQWTSGGDGYTQSTSFLH